MAKIPTPDRGQPLDVAYIYQIVEAINELSAQTSSATYKYASVDTSNGTQNLLVTETKIVAGEVTVYSAPTQVTAGTTVPFQYSFKGEYKYPPIVTATPVLLATTNAGRDVSIVIENITTSRVDGKITFRSGGSVSLKIDILAVGVPV